MQLCIYIVLFLRYSELVVKNSLTLNLPHLHLEPQLGVTPVKFCRYLWCQKTKVPGLSCRIVCMILCLAVLTQYWLVTDRQTHDNGIIQH